MTRLPDERYDDRSRERADDGVVHRLNPEGSATLCGRALEGQDWVALRAAIIDCPGCVDASPAWLGPKPVSPRRPRGGSAAGR